MRRPIARAAGAVAVVAAAVTACGTATTTVVRAPKPKPAASRTVTAKPAPAAGYLGDVFGGGTGNPCNFGSGYRLSDCNPKGETEQQYIDGVPRP
jgi:hypothetical protein